AGSPGVGVTRSRWGGRRRLAVLVDESAASGVSLDRSAAPNTRRHRHCWAHVGRSCAGRRVVALDILAEQLFEVSAVPDEGAVAEFAAYGADPRREATQRKTRATPEFSTARRAGLTRRRRHVVVSLWHPRGQGDR